MSNEFDPELRRLFAESSEPLDGGEFGARVLIEIEKARRVQLWRRLGSAAAALVILALAMPRLAPMLVGAVEQAGRLSFAAATFQTTPAGWAVSLTVGAVVFARTRYSRR
jgi:hypothetical protein